MIRAIAVAAALMFSTAGAAQQADPSKVPLAAAPDYTQDSAWLCLPGRSDACSTPLGTVALNPNGYGSIGQVKPAANPPVDCFYIYPTISKDPGLNSDLIPAEGEEKLVTMNQFTRFSTVCRPFAPMYRQATLQALVASVGGRDVTRNTEIAHSDVVAAWRQFLAHRNKDRPFVIVDHSQGAIRGIQLIQEEIDGKPVAKRMLSAILLGWAVEVPEGKVVGGTFKSIPLCTREGQIGCVLTWMSFRAESPPAANSFLGRAARAGMTAGCTNPAALGSDRSAKLDSYWMTTVPLQVGATAVEWSSQGKPPVPFVRTEGLVSGACAHDGQAGYLAITVNADPKDARTDRTPGDVYIAGRLTPGWGLHVVDMSVAQGDLLRLVQAQGETYRRTMRKRRA